MSETPNTPLTVNVNQSHVRNAVRDIVEKLLLPESARQSFDIHTQKQKKRLDEHIDQMIAGIVVSPAQVNRMVENLLNRDLQRMVRDIVKHEVETLLRDEVSVVIRQVAQSGLSLEIGTGWKRSVNLKTQLKESQDDGKKT